MLRAAFFSFSLSLFFKFYFIKKKIKGGKEREKKTTKKTTTRNEAQKKSPSWLFLNPTSNMPSNCLPPALSLRPLSPL